MAERTARMRPKPNDCCEDTTSKLPTTVDGTVGNCFNVQRTHDEEKPKCNVCLAIMVVIPAAGRMAAAGWGVPRQGRLESGRL
eukprot:scaffold92305_cov39-Prasinocladus_malaysianus.AAC.1